MVPLSYSCVKYGWVGRCTSTPLMSNLMIIKRKNPAAPGNNPAVVCRQVHRPVSDLVTDVEVKCRKPPYPSALNL